MRRRGSGFFLKVISVLGIAMLALSACGGGSSTPAPPSPPAAPSSVTANPGDTQATLIWSAVSGATSYNIYYGTAPGVTKATGTKITGATSPRVVAGLPNGTACYFVVTAENSAGESPESAERSATPTSTPPPSAPGGVRAEAGDNTVTVSWDAVAGATSYNIYYGTSAGVTKATGTKITGATSPRIVTGLANGTTYYFVVTAENANGESSESFEVSGKPTAATPPPSAPTGVGAAAGNGQATVSWSTVGGATSYNIYYSTSAGVTKATGTKITGATSPRIVTGLANGTTYYFVVTAVGTGGESAESSEVSARPTAPGAFSQADITGTWDVIEFTSGGGDGGSWMHATGVFDGAGNITSVTNYLESNGNADPGTPTFKWTIDSSGVVSASEGGVDQGFHGRMSSDKKLITGVQTWDNTSSPHQVAMTIARKRTGTIFNNTDLVNVPFAFHQLGSGLDNTWHYGTGSTNASREISLTSSVGPAGPDPDPPPPNFDTLSVSAEGIVTFSGNTAFYGLMTDDKKVIFAIDGDINGGYYNLIVITVTGQAFTLADLAGEKSFVALRNTLPNPIWAYGVTSFDSSGNGTYLSYTDKAGNPAPADFTRAISATGVVTDPADATFYGQMSYNKDLVVRTNTNASGRYGLSLSIR